MLLYVFIVCSCLRGYVISCCRVYWVWAFAVEARVEGSGSALSLQVRGRTCFVTCSKRFLSRSYVSFNKSLYPPVPPWRLSLLSSREDNREAGKRKREQGKQRGKQGLSLCLWLFPVNASFLFSSILFYFPTSNATAFLLDKSSRKYTDWADAL